MPAADRTTPVAGVTAAGGTTPAAGVTAAGGIAAAADLTAAGGIAPAADLTAAGGIAPAADLTAAGGTAPSAGAAARAGRQDAPAAGATARAGRAWLRPGNWLVVVIPAVAELVVGGYRLGGASLWRDEAYTIDAARRTNGQILALIGHVDAVHGPYYLCMHVVVGILGTSAAAVRLPSLLGMSVAAGCTAALGRRLARMAALPAPPVTGLTAGLLLVAAPLTTYYAQDARPYGLVTMLAVIATQLLITCLADGRWRWWAAYGAAIALTGMFSLFALLLLFAHGATLLVTRARTRNRAGNGDDRRNERERQARPQRWLAAAAAAIFLVSPLIILGYRQGQTLALGDPARAVGRDRHGGRLRWLQSAHPAGGGDRGGLRRDRGPPPAPARIHRD